jgi:hypothetical protein
LLCTMLKVSLILLQLKMMINKILKNTHKLDDGMMQTRGEDGKWRHLLWEVLLIFAQENACMIRLLGRQKYINIMKTSITWWVEGVSFLLLYFYLSWVCCWVCCKKWIVGFVDSKERSLFPNCI